MLRICSSFCGGIECLAFKGLVFKGQGLDTELIEERLVLVLAGVVGGACEASGGVVIQIVSQPLTAVTRST